MDVPESMREQYESEKAKNRQMRVDDAYAASRAVAIHVDRELRRIDRRLESIAGAAGESQTLALQVDKTFQQIAELKREVAELNKRVTEAGKLFVELKKSIAGTLEPAA